MFIDAREVGSSSVETVDLCVIGSGAAGISIATEFLGSQYSVCLIEGGDMYADQSSQKLYLGEMVQEVNSNSKLNMLRNLDGYLIGSRLRAFGGTTSLWTGMCRPLDRLDFSTRPWVEYSGWPIYKSDLIPYYNRACKKLDIASFDYEPENGEAHEFDVFRIANSKRILSRVFHWSPPTRFGEKYQTSLNAAKNIRVYINANAVNLGTNRNVDHMAELDVRTLSGNKFPVRARVYILAIGGIENARLLLASTNDNPNGLGNDNDLVGRFFMVHIEESAGLVFVNNTFEDLGNAARTVFSQRLGHNIYRVHSPTEEAQRNHGLLNSSVRIERWAWPENKPTFKALSTEDKYITQNFKSFDQWLEEADLSLIKKFLIGRKKPEFPVCARINIASEQSPNPNSRLMLSDKKDELGMRRVKLNWQLTDRDYQSMESFLRLLGSELGRASQGRIKILLRASDLKPVGYGWHHMGTTRMHENEKYGVVDSNCKIHVINNLYIAGSSVFPNCGYANPTMTIVALSLRLADHVKNDLEKK